MLENVRMDSAERKAFLYAIEGIKDEVYLMGSRLHPEKKGGDIDVLIYSKENSLSLSMKVKRRFFSKCEEKIDVIVFNKDNLTSEQQAFVNTLKLLRVK